MTTISKTVTDIAGNRMTVNYYQSEEEPLMISIEHSFNDDIISMTFEEGVLKNLIDFFQLLKLAKGDN